MMVSKSVFRDRSQGVRGGVPLSRCFYIPDEFT